MNKYIKEIEYKLNQMGIASSKSIQLSEDKTLNELEEKLEITLPNDYKFFLSKFGRLDFNEKEIVINNSIKLVNFFGIENDNFNLKLLFERYHLRIPEEMIPVAECVGGELLCLGIKKQQTGKIFYWDHEKEKTDITFESEVWEPVTLLFSSFMELILELDERTVEIKSFDDSIVEEIKITDKFLSRFNK